MQNWFLAEPRNRQPPAISLKSFKKLWNDEECLKERKASSHSKCSVCCQIDLEFDKLRGNNTSDAVLKRKLLGVARAEHERNHLGERSEMDHACLLSVVEPHRIWVIMADAATQKNFELPRLQHNRCKDLQNVPWYGMKLMATYAPGFGFSPYLVHDSMFSGANLLWSVVWLTLCSMRDHYGYLPAELHLQLDNTSGENKNNTMVAMASWLVHAGYFKRVRVFFLLVGHTHIIIDQVFGVITKSIKSQQLLEVRDLVAAIGTALLPNPQYRAQEVKVLPALWDFKGFVQKFGRLASLTYLTGNPQYYDEQGGWQGYRDFLFDGRGLSMRQSTRDAYLDHVEVLIDEPPAEAWPEIAANKAPDAWRKKNGKDVQSTIYKALSQSKFQNHDAQLQAARRWEAHLSSIPTDWPSLKAANPAPLPRLSLNSIGIAHAPANGPGATDEFDEFNAILQEFGVVVCDRMMNPTVNPMVTSQQSATQLRLALERERALLRCSSKPTVSSTSAVYPGDFAVVDPGAGMALELVHITKIEGGRSPVAPDLAFFANVYEQTQNDDHAGGLFGTFKEKLVQNTDARQKTQRRKNSVRLRREQVRVFNVRPLGTGAQRRLHLATLRLVAEVDERPCYAIPNELPKTHKHDDSHSSDEEEELGDDDGPPAIRAAKAPARPNGGRTGRRTGSSDTSSDEDSSSEESEEPKSGTDSSDDDGSSADEDAEQREARERLQKCADFALTAKDGQLVFIDLTGDATCSKHKYPCELAHISALIHGTDEDGMPLVHGTVRWYGRRFCTKGFPTKNKANFAKYETKDGAWCTEHNIELTHSMLPIELPCALYLENPPEQVSLSALFMRGVAEKCEEFGVMND